MMSMSTLVDRQERDPDDYEAFSCNVCPSTVGLNVLKLKVCHLLFRRNNACMNYNEMHSF